MESYQEFWLMRTIEFHNLCVFISKIFYLWNDCLKSALNFVSSSVIEPNCLRVISASADAIGLLINEHKREKKIMFGMKN